MRQTWLLKSSLRKVTNGVLQGSVTPLLDHFLFALHVCPLSNPCIFTIESGRSAVLIVFAVLKNNSEDLKLVTSIFSFDSSLA